MGEVEQTEGAQKDFDVQVKDARAAGNLDARRGLKMLVERLQEGIGYYVWAPLGEEELETWQVRLPRTDMPDEPWLKEEDAALVHICDPVGFLEKIETRDRDGSAEHVGYVRDADNALADATEYTCRKCDRKMPKDLAKKGKAQVAMHQLAQKVS